MDCKKAQDLILTDYIDQEASLSVQESVRAHLASCEKCRAFEQEVRAHASEDLRNAGHIEPPAEVWNRIRDAIGQEQRPSGVPAYVDRMFDFLRESFFARRPAYAFATAFTVMLAAIAVWGLPMRRQMLARDYLVQKTSFMIALNSPANGETDAAVDFNTAIEEYLF